MSSVFPFSTVTVVCGVVPFAPVHPVNVYPSFVGFTNVNVSVSTVYSALGFSWFPPSHIYVIIYVFAVLLALAVTVVSDAGIVISVVCALLFEIVTSFVAVHVKLL